MTILGADILARAQRDHATARGRLAAWNAEVAIANWGSFNDVKDRFPATDMVKKRLVFNIGGNNYRLVAGVDFEAGVIRVRWFGTHVEYNKIKLEDV